MGYSVQFVRLALRRYFFLPVPLLTGVLLCLLCLLSCQQPEDQLFATHFEPYKDIISKRGAVDNASPILLQAMGAYNQQTYGDAIAHFQQSLADDADNPAIHFYLGISYLSINKAKKAIPHFTSVLDQQDPIFGSHTVWYLALAYLKSGQRKEAIELMENINRSDSRYSQPCAQILAALPGEQSLMGETAASN